jgi:hypothetical protein
VKLTGLSPARFKSKRSPARGLLFCLASVLALACNRAGTNSSPPVAAPKPAPALVIREVDSPAKPDSREPELHASPDGGRLVMSWVEKTGEKRYALRYAARDAGGWSEVRTVAEGENRFINWADFPSVVELQDGSLAAHWLVKSGPSRA